MVVNQHFFSLPSLLSEITKNGEFTNLWEIENISMY